MRRRLLLVVILLILIPVLLYLSLALFVSSKYGADTANQSDAILVLGARSYINGDYNPCLKARVDHAVSLYKSNLSPVLIMSGGDDIEDNINEAETMKKIAMESGVPEEAILLEKEATSTYENFVNSEKILKQKGIDSVIVVTEPFHLARASLIADKLRLNYTTSPAKDSPCSQNGNVFTKYFLKEPLAIIMYSLRGQL